MAEVASLMRELVLEKLFTREVLEIRVVDPAFADVLIGQAVDVLEQEQPDHEPALDPRPALRAVERRDLAIDPVPVILAPSCTSSCFRLMIWSSLARNRSPSPVVSGFFGRIVPLRCDHGITAADSKESRKRNRKLPRLSTPKACNLKTASSEI